MIYQGKICPYCCGNTEYVDSAVVYGTSYGMIYYCKRDKAWVGVHKGTSNALGRLANDELREWRKRAHAAFDPLWKMGLYTRKNAYLALSRLLEIPFEYCHMAYFSVDTCKKVVAIMEDIFKQLSIKK